LAAWSASPARFREDANAEEDLVLGGYRDRVLIELAQNAADAAARAGAPGRLRFELDGDVLRAANTGMPIDAAGVESASTLRASSKRDDTGGELAGTGAGAGVSAIGAVGRFGVGFAAVLAVTDEPAIVTRHAGVFWSRARTHAELATIASLHEELARRGDAVPVLRLPFADDRVGGAARRPPEGFDTEVVLPLRDAAASALARELLAGVDAALLLTLPALASIEIVVDGESRRLDAAPTSDGVVVDGVRWRLHTASGDLDAELLRDRPVEERARRHFSLTWAVPVDDRGTPLGLPASVPSMMHAPTPTDEPLSLPALLIAPLPLDPTRRHVADGALRDFLIARAADAYVELIRELPAVPGVLTLVPVGVARGALDGMLRALVAERLRATAFVASHDDGVRLRPSEALLLDDGGVVGDDALINLLGEVLPSLVPAGWARAGLPALGALGVRRIALAEVVEELAALEKPASWWRSLYAALAGAGVSLDALAGLPVPLASGALARSPRGLSMPAALGDLGALGLRGVDPEAAHPLLSRLGAIDPEPAAILAGERVRAVVENSYDADDPAAIADTVLRLVAASGASVADHPWLAELALPAADGELYAAGELLLPQGKLANLVIDDSPFGVVDDALIERWGPALLAAVGVLDGFAVVHADDVTDAEHDLDGEDDYLDLVASVLEGDEPVVVDELVAVRDLELVRDDAWPQALALLAQPPYRAAVVEPVVASAGARRARVVPYTAWWLRRHGVVEGRLAASDPLLEGLYDVASVDLDDEFLVAAGVLREVGDADADDLVSRLADPARVVTRAQARALYAQVTPRDPPVAVRAVRGGSLEVVAANDAVVVDQPDLLPLLGDLAVVPAALDDAERVADALDVVMASELGAFAVVSAGEARDDHVVHEALMVADVDGVARRVAWRLVGGVLHVDAGSYAFGLGRGRAWRAGDWRRRHLETELARDPEAATVWLAEADLDAGG